MTRRGVLAVTAVMALLGIPAAGSAEGRATIPGTTQLTVSLSRGAAFTVTVRFTPTALARRTVARLLATNPRSRPGDGEVSVALEPSAAYLDFVFETARACAAELTPIETPGAAASAASAVSPASPASPTSRTGPTRTASSPSPTCSPTTADH